MSSQYAQLTNVKKFNNLMQYVMHRDPNLPSMVVFYGASGLGKTTSAIFGAMLSDARYIQVGASWTKKKLITEIAKQHGIHDVRTIGSGMEQIIDAVNYEPKPIIIDEADYLVAGNMIQLIREIHDETHCPIVLMGEGQLSMKLRKYEMVYNRVLKWEQAEKCSIEDTILLADMYATGLDMAEDLIQALNTNSDGIARRIVVNTTKIKAAALGAGIASIDLAKFIELSSFNTALVPTGGRSV